MVISNLAMPSVSGWEVAQAVRQGDPAMLVILLTGWPDAVDHDRARQLGIVPIIGQPTKTEELLNAVCEARRRRLTLRE